MKKRYMLRCAVFLILTKIRDNSEYVLLQRRYNTGILDGKYDVSCSGHLEEGETLIQAMIRESYEEIGIVLEPSDLKCSSIMHANFKDGEYLLVSFCATKYKGDPRIMEKDKCNELKWFNINELPEDIIDTRKTMIESYKNNNFYSEYGFDKSL